LFCSSAIIVCALCTEPWFGSRRFVVVTRGSVACRARAGGELACGLFANFRFDCHEITFDRASASSASFR
jgi:hypothetical protein